MTDGYPDDNELEMIREWHWDDFTGLMEYVYDLWWCKGSDIKEGNTYTFATGGWSGNESIISALHENRKFFWTTCWVRSERGGLYVFEAWDIKK